MNPGWRSPADVVADPDYRDVTSEGKPEHSYWPHAMICVVFHAASGTYWQAVYAIDEDSSDYGTPHRWEEVLLVEVKTRVWTKPLTDQHKQKG